MTNRNNRRLKQDSASADIRAVTRERNSGAEVVLAEMEAESTSNGAADRESIAQLAYSYWEARGSSDGSAEEDWYRAEEALKKRAAAAAA
jgi:hypothetical protein